ncbi:MAG: TVP38/TMEM64 family protein, partial [Bosea sp. (in: a-proteobacteria)]
EGFREDAASYMLFLRLVPVFPFWLVNLAPALAGVPLSTFLWTTLVGIVPGTFAFAFAGAGLDSVVAAQAAARASCLAAGRTDCSAGLDLKALVTPQLLTAFALLGLVALVPVIWRKLKARSSKANEQP